MIDLHVHSTFSDGTYTPTELIKLAKSHNMQAMALTDHDTIAGNKEAMLAAQSYGIEFINGMEMGLNYNDHQIHVVALGFDMNNEVFQEFYADLRYKKENSIVNVIDYLKKQGIDISVEKVEPFVADNALDKYAILRYLVASKSSEGDVQYLWDTYIDPAFTKLNLKLTENPKAEDAIYAIKAAGGKTSLAHYHKGIGLKNYSRSEQEQQIKYLHEMGLDGMEAMYPNYTDEDREFASYLITKYNLLATGGTDFHGANRPSVQLGSGINGNMNVPYSFWQKLQASV